MAKSTSAGSDRKPAKPYEAFPLFPHATNRWAKKIRGLMKYFGPTATDPNGDAALAKWMAEKEYLLAGLEPPPKPRDGAFTVRDLCNEYRAHKKMQRDAGEITPRTFYDCESICERIIEQFGKERAVEGLTPADFRGLREALDERCGLVRLRNEMQRVRSVFKFAFDEAHIAAPIRFGQSFAKPKPDAVRRQREANKAAHGKRMFEADELRAIIEKAEQPMRAMVLLAANCGFGQTDLSSLPIRAVDLERGWVEFPRPKTGVPRWIPLWPETIAAVRESLRERPEPKEQADAGLVFITKYGHRWVKSIGKGTPSDSLGKEFTKLLGELKLKRPGVSFYAIRHGFETIGGGSLDQVAVDSIMGHADRSMAGHYREGVGDDRLRAVVNHVRKWLWPTASTKKAPKKGGVFK